MNLDFRSKSQTSTLERRHIHQMLRHIEEYEEVSSKRHKVYKTVTAFYKAHGLCKQNFIKYYRRYTNQGRRIEALLPHKTGRKFKDSLQYSPEVIEQVKDIRSKGYNRYDISNIMKKVGQVEISPSSVYRLLKKLGLNKLNPVIKEEVRRIIKLEAGELGHVDIHYVTKGTVKETGDKKLYILGVIDSYSRICWLEVLDSIKAVNVMFNAMDILLRMKDRYGIEYKEMLSDNGQEFSSRNNPDHPFERMLTHFDIKHRYTKPFTPKTNGKIERFWKTIEDELLSGETFETLDEFKHYITGYCVYYNEHRMHQGINNKIPVNTLDSKEKIKLFPEPASHKSMQDGVGNKFIFGGAEHKVF